MVLVGVYLRLLYCWEGFRAAYCPVPVPMHYCQVEALNFHCVSTEFVRLVAVYKIVLVGRYISAKNINIIFSASPIVINGVVRYYYDESPWTDMIVHAKDFHQFLVQKQEKDEKERRKSEKEKFAAREAKRQRIS